MTRDGTEGEVTAGEVVAHIAGLAVATCLYPTLRGGDRQAIEDEAVRILEAYVRQQIEAAMAKSDQS